MGPPCPFLGTIKRFTEHLDPRGAHVWALEKPSD